MQNGPGLVERNVEERDRHAADVLFHHSGLGRHGRTQRRIEQGVDPTLVRELRLAHPGRHGGCFNHPDRREPGVHRGVDSGPNTDARPGDGWGHSS
jgi:hypothetical protein